jgi:hypothetical protein
MACGLLSNAHPFLGDYQGSTGLRESNLTNQELYLKTLGLLLLAIGMSGAAMAATVPEIDPSSGVSALALLSGALLVIRGRRKR